MLVIEQNTKSYNMEHETSSLNFEAVEKLQYDIYRFSSFLIEHVPENVLIDDPCDQTSRWSPNDKSPPQYLILKLRRPSIVQYIKFGKFQTSHACNVKKFRIYGGLTEEMMPLLLEAGLRNDHIPETFILRHKTVDESGYLPIMYLKIVPLMSWGPTFNCSIWYVELCGQDDPMFTTYALQKYNKLREMEIVRLCLKHFRQQGYDKAFQALQEQTQISLEHPVITELHKCLVEDGEFVQTEKLISGYIDKGLMDSYLNRQNYKHTWNLQTISGSLQPSKRGGHQLVMDPEKHLIYLYGGWDGFMDLSDLWVFQVTTNSWIQLCAHSEECNGPTPRSCHKMVFDPITKNIYILGRFIDNSNRTKDYMKSDFYVYDTRANSWSQLCDDTSRDGGPQLIYDHQMCIDADKHTIFVFGGKVLTPRVTTTTPSSGTVYSGLYSYNIDTNTWTQIMVERCHPNASPTDMLWMKSRKNHCMVFHPKRRKLYIYGGQRVKIDMHEFISYDIDTQSVEILNTDYYNWFTSLQNGDNDGDGSNDGSDGSPPPYALRATIDCERDEIYLFSSLCKSNQHRDMYFLESINSLWVYSLNRRKWSRVYICNYDHWENNTLNIKERPLEPCPRYAHQFIYDDTAKLHYMFGGNPGKSEMPYMRLDDFWVLKLEKPKRIQIFNHCRYLIRKLHFKELARSNPMEAVRFLRSRISEIINHDNDEQVDNFHKLACFLFKTDDEWYSCCSNTKHKKLIAPEEEKKEDEKERSYDEALKFLTQSQPPEVISSELKSSEECIKHSRHAVSLCHVKSHRSFIFNKLLQLLPPDIVQPKRDLSDFVII